MKKILFSLFICLVLVGCGNEKENKQVQKLPFEYSNFLAHKTSIKYQSNVKLEIKNDEIPNVNNMKQIFETIIKEHKGYENYFSNFYLNKTGMKNQDIKLFQFSKLGNGNIEVSNLWPQLYYDSDILIPNEYNRVSGFVKYSDINLKLEESLSEIESKIGKTIFEKDGDKVYIVYNERNQIVGYLLLVLKEEKLNDLIFVLPYPTSDEEYKKIESYFLGNRNQKIKDFQDVGGINIKLRDFTRKFMLAKQMLGDSKASVELPEEKNLKEIIYDGDEGFLIKFYVKNKEINRIELVQLEEKTDETYRKFIEESMFIYTMSKNNVLDRGVYNIFEKLGFNYKKYEQSEDYNSEYEEGNIKYKIIITSETCIFEIKNI